MILVMVAFAGCGDDDDRGGDGAAMGNSGPGALACPDLRGDWRVATHCSQREVGVVVTITQEGCTFWDAEFDLEGAIADDGSFTSAGSTPTGEFECTGTATAEFIEEQCAAPDGSSPCAVTFTR